jgi:preprotein translocase subunit SecD
MFWFRWKHPIKMLVIIGLCVGCWFLFTPVAKTVHLGLDLQGGLRTLVELEPNDQYKTITAELQDEELQVLENRLNQLGTSEITFSKVGLDRINIEMPGLTDPHQALQLIQQAAVLEMRPLTAAQVNKALANIGGGLNPSYDPKFDAYKASGPPVITGDDLSHSEVAYGQGGGAPVVTFTLKSDGARRFLEWTRKNIGNPLPIFLDKKLVEAPTIQGAIGASGQIEGNFTTDQAVLLANELNSGALKVPTRVIEVENVGPVLGRIDLQKSLTASLVGLGIVLLFMLVVYRVPGVLADLALVVYCFLMLGYVTYFGVVLTLPGIAGFVLSIGMAVDANVLIFERIKEELWSGRTTRAAVGVGFKRAFTTVFDSHVTTIVGAAVLYWLGTGTVKGFALTLLVGTVFSLLTAVNITRAFTDLVVDNDIANKPVWYGA